MEKFFYFNDLFSIYRSLLTENEQEIFSSYYEDNLSMGEISFQRGVSRAHIGNTIKMVERKLEDYEEKLHLYQIRKQIMEIYDIIDDKNIKEVLENMLK